VVVRSGHQEVRSQPSGTGAVVDLLVGAVALGDGAVSVIGEPERVAVWSAGSVALAVAVAVLVHRHRREPAIGRRTPARS